MLNGLSATGKVRDLILEMAFNAGKNGAHVGSALSCADILTTCYDYFDFLNKKKSDIFILSKGHAALCQFAVLAYRGVIESEEIGSFNQDASELFCHSKANPHKSLDFSGGSLGLGLSYSVGLAIYLKVKKRPGNVVCLVGDGELDEGISGRQ